MENIPTSQFIQPCSMRTANSKVAYCSQLQIGNKLIGVTPTFCAKCMIRGTPDANLINAQVLSLLNQELNLVTLGFNRDEAYIFSIISKYFSLIKSNKKACLDL